jgi:hypothetical protein
MKYTVENNLKSGSSAVETLETRVGYPTDDRSPRDRLKRNCIELSAIEN